MDWMLFAKVITDVIGPVFLLAGLGFVLDKRFRLDLKTLTQLIMFVFIPTAVFLRVIDPGTPFSEISAAAGFSGIMFVTLMAAGFAVAFLLSFRRSLRFAFVNSVYLYNSANFGLPVAFLAFGEEGMKIQVGVMLVQAILTSTMGVFFASAGQGSLKQAFKTSLRYPTLYAAAAALAFRYCEWTLPSALHKGLSFLDAGMIPVALITVGVQLSRIDWRRIGWPVFLSNGMRLLGGPALAYLLILALGLKGVLAGVLFVTAAGPTAVNSGLLAIHFDNEPDFASSAVFSSTLLGGLSVALAIYLVRSGVLGL